jgi:glycosyltransferase involved in cell wall biosynthesis
VALPTGLPLVVTFRGDDVQGIIGDDGRYLWSGALLARLSQAVARRADAVILVSEHMRAYLSPGVPAEVIPSGIDLDAFRPRPRAEARASLGLDPHARLVLFVGDPASGRKRCDLARAAVERLAPSLAARLIVAWQRPHAEVALLMNACDALVFTSAQEGSPNVVKEALACDLPVVSVAVGDVEERLRGIEGCELCADDRVETIAGALERCLQRGRRIEGRRAVAGLDERLLTERVLDVYRGVLERRARRARPASA